MSALGRLSLDRWKSCHVRSEIFLPRGAQAEREASCCGDNACPELPGAPCRHAGVDNGAGYLTLGQVDDGAHRQGIGGLFDRGRNAVKLLLAPAAVVAKGLDKFGEKAGEFAAQQA